MCQSRAEGGQRCAAYTREALTAAVTEHRNAIFAAHRCDVAVAEREDTLAAELGVSAHDLPEDLYITDDTLLAVSSARRDAEDLVNAKRRAVDSATVDYAMTPSGRQTVAAWAENAAAAGDVRKAARWMHLLNQADDTVEYRDRQRARYGASAGHLAVPVRSGARPRHLSLVV